MALLAPAPSRPAALATAQQPAAPPTTVAGVADGNDFSGTVLADAEQDACAICKKAFEVRWDAARQALVCDGAVMLQHRIHHQGQEKYYDYDLRSGFQY